MTFALILLAGCSNQPAKVSGADVSPATAATAAMEAYDKNTDGFLDDEELAACPPLLAAKAAYDADTDAKISTTEIESHLTTLFGSGASLTNIDGSVTLGNQPLAGATVRLKPVAWLAGALPEAEGVTDDQGSVRPTIAKELIPEKLQAAPLVYPGLYSVEITHSEKTIAARYNTATELGWEVDPSSRTGTSARFDLKSN